MSKAAFFKFTVRFGVWIPFLTAFFPAAFAESVRIRAGHFPNVTHAPALIAHAGGHFEKAFGNDAKIEWKIFSAGPSAIEALFAGELDILYVGPNPAVNGFVRSKGAALRIVVGVAGGGSAFVVRPESGIKEFKDIAGKRAATPQIGNTQDVAFRYLLKQNGLSLRPQGGNVDLFNLQGGDQLIGFAKRQVDAVWTVEPWVSRLVAEAGGQILFEEKELWPDGRYATTVLVASKKFLGAQPEFVERWVRVHAEIVDWMNSHPEEAKEIFNQELKAETGKPLPPEYLDTAFKRIFFTTDPMEPSIRESARRAEEIGLLPKGNIDLQSLFVPLTPATSSSDGSVRRFNGGLPSPRRGEDKGEGNATG